MSFAITPMTAILKLNGINDLSGPAQVLAMNLRALAETLDLPRVKINISEADLIPPSNRMVLNDFITELRNNGIDTVINTEPEIFTRNS